MFNEIDIDGYFLEYDSKRAGGFEPLRFFPKGKKQLVLGLVTSKSGTLEKKDDIKRRIEAYSNSIDQDPCAHLRVRWTQSARARTCSIPRSVD
jgi:methionine synthase II (cobalamin-independent)